MTRGTHGGVSPAPFDGYLTQTPAGWEVSAEGSTVGCWVDPDEALAVLREHSAGKPQWLVRPDGTHTRID